MTLHPPCDPTPDSAGDRRARLRQATISEIKQAAREHLLRHGPGELSLRAVARDVGVTPSALYRYFESRAALVAALSADALTSATTAVAVAAGDDDQRPEEQLRAMFGAIRAWSHRHQSEFELLFANRDDQTHPHITQSVEMQRLVALPLAAAMAALAEGTLAPDGHPPALSAAAIAAAPDDIDQEALAEAMLVCMSCVGWLYLEHFGLIAWPADEADAAFVAYLDGILGPRGPG